MTSRRLRSVMNDQRGIALPLALILLTLLMSLTLAFMTMGSTEPTIATNLKSGEMALAAAEAGIERAIWALSNPTVDTAGANTKLGDLANIPGPYKSGTETLFALALGGSRAFSVTITVGPAAAPPCTVPAGQTCITAHGYVARNGVTLPAQPTGLAQSDIIGHRVVQLQFSGTTGGNKVGGPAAGTSGVDVKLPGALSVAGTVQLSGNALVDGSDLASGMPNGCASKAGVTVRQQTTSNGTTTTNTISVSGSASTVGTPAQQSVAGDQNTSTFQQYLLTSAQLAALKSLAQSQGTYVMPTSNSEFILTVGNGLTFVDTVNGQTLGNPADPSMMAKVKITGANNSGWLIVMGNLRIDGNVTYNGFVYAANTFTYHGTGTGGIYGAVVSANAVDSVASVVDTTDSGNSKVYYDCNKVANGGSAFTPTLQNGLNRVIVSIVSGSWREVSN